MRLRVQALVNATPPAHNLAFALYPVTVKGPADTLSFVAGAAVSGSSVTLNTPSASTVNSTVGSDFAIPIDGTYLIGVKPSASMAGDSAVQVAAQLQHHYEP
jgi:hypothetical protein